jgi:outer membrane protein insertion porin family
LNLIKHILTGAVSALLVFTLALPAFAQGDEDAQIGSDSSLIDEGGPDAAVFDTEAAAEDSEAAPAADDGQVQAGDLVPTYASDDEDIQIRNLHINGLHNLDDSSVLTNLTIRPGDILVGNYTEKLHEAAQALYDSGWFQDTPELSLDPAGPGAANLEVTVVENPLYAGTQITGNTLFSEDRLLAEVEGPADASGMRAGGVLVPGEVINNNRVVDAVERVLDVYQAAGYVSVQPGQYGIGTGGDEEGMVNIPLVEGVVDEIIVTGNDKTNEGVIRSQITHVHTGEILRREDIERDLQQIYNTGLFEAVTPTFEPGLEAGKMKMVVEVEEAATGQAGVGLGYSTVNGLQGTLSYSEKNLFGNGKAVDGQIIFSRNQPGFEINLSDPYAGRNSFWSAGIFNLHSRQQRFPGQPYESELEIDTKGVNFAYGQHISDTDSWQSAFTVTDYDYDIRKGDPFRGLTARQRARLSAQGETRKLGLSYLHDTRDNKFDSHEGFMGQATGEFAGFGGDFQFNKYTLEAREFTPMGPGTFAMRQRLGTSTGTLPIYEEFRLGGVNSIRGVSEDLLTGSSSLLTNFEYRYQLNKMFGVVGFVDSGWAGESLSSMDHALGAGVGARVKIRALGIGAVRLDYGWALAGADSGSRFHFFLGEMF